MHIPFSLSYKHLIKNYMKYLIFWVLLRSNTHNYGKKPSRNSLTGLDALFWLAICWLEKIACCVLVVVVVIADGLEEAKEELELKNEGAGLGFVLQYKKTWLFVSIIFLFWFYFFIFKNKKKIFFFINLRVQK